MNLPQRDLDNIANAVALKTAEARPQGHRGA